MEKFEVSKQPLSLQNKYESKDSELEKEKVDILYAHEDDANGILKVQQEYLLKNINYDQKSQTKRGFLFFETSKELLKEIINNEKIIISKINNEIAGYIISMTPERTAKSDFFTPFIENIKKIKYKNKSLNEYNYLFYAQQAINKKYQGKGLARKMHEKLKEDIKDKYDLGLSEINKKNKVSLKVNVDRLGLQIVGEFRDDYDEEWYVIVDDLNIKSEIKKSK